MGLANVQAVLAAAGGEYTISCRELWFCFTFTLPALPVSPQNTENPA